MNNYEKIKAMTLDEMAEFLKEQFNEYNKYRQTLQEIKAMCEKHIRAEKIVMAQEVIDLITKVESEG